MAAQQEHHDKLFQVLVQNFSVFIAYRSPYLLISASHKMDYCCSKDLVIIIYL